MDKVFLNEEYITTGNGPFENRGFLYGDGVFETINMQAGVLSYLKDHLLRLKEALTHIQINAPAWLTENTLINVANTLAIDKGLNEKARIKIIVWRKPGGLYKPTSHEADVLITVKPYIASPEIKNQVYFYNDVCKNFSSISKYKTLSCLPYVHAATEAADNYADDMILLDAFGHVSECLASNVFFIKNTTLYTPSLPCACIDGVMRKQILAKCPDLGISLQEGIYHKKDIISADFVFTSNVSGLSAIAKVEETVFKRSHEIYVRFKQIYPGH